MREFAQRTINVETVSMILAQRCKHLHRTSIGPMLDQCCCKVADAGQTLTQHWVNIEVYLIVTCLTWTCLMWRGEWTVWGKLFRSYPRNKTCYGEASFIIHMFFISFHWFFPEMSHCHIGTTLNYHDLLMLCQITARFSIISTQVQQLYDHRPTNNE